MKGLAPRVAHVMYGAATANGTKGTQFRFSTLFVGVVKELMLFVFVARTLADHIDTFFEDRSLDQWVSKGQLPEIESLKKYARKVEGLLSEIAEESLKETSYYTTDNPYTSLSLGPAFVFAWIMRRLALRQVSDRLEIPRPIDLYKSFHEKLVSFPLFRECHKKYHANNILKRSHAYHYPRKRHLRDFNLLEEELEAIKSVTNWQSNTLRGYREVFSDESYAQLSRRRQTLHRLELRLVNYTLGQLASLLRDYRSIIESCAPLGEKIKNSVEVNEEDHGKAIFVLTVVTAIFLPLSFVTSYLGMNTSDIRAMAQGQSIFWATALPVSITMVVLVLGVAYHSDDLRESLAKTFDRRTLMGYTNNSTSASKPKVGHRIWIPNGTNLFNLNRENPVMSAEYWNPVNNPTTIVSRAQVATNTLEHFGLPFEYGVSIHETVFSFYDMGRVLTSSFIGQGYGRDQERCSIRGASKAHQFFETDSRRRSTGGTRLQLCLYEAPIAICTRAS